MTTSRSEGDSSSNAQPRSPIRQSISDRVEALCLSAAVSGSCRVKESARGVLPEVRRIMTAVVDEAVASAAAVDEGRASVIAVSLDLRPPLATIVVRDDGAALSYRDVFGARPGRVGVAGLRRRLRDVGGDLSFRGREPRGVELVGRVPIARDGSLRWA